MSYPAGFNPYNMPYDQALAQPPQSPFQSRQHLPNPTGKVSVAQYSIPGSYFPQTMTWNNMSPAERPLDQRASQRYPGNPHISQGNHHNHLESTYTVDSEDSDTDSEDTHVKVKSTTTVVQHVVESKATRQAIADFFKNSPLPASLSATPTHTPASTPTSPAPVGAFVEQPSLMSPWGLGVVLMPIPPYEMIPPGQR